MIVVKAGGCGEHGSLMRQEAIIMIRSTANIIAFALMHACESISLFLVRVSNNERAHHNGTMGLWDYGNMGHTCSDKMGNGNKWEQIQIETNGVKQKLHGLLARKDEGWILSQYE